MIKYLVIAIVVGIIACGTAYFGFYDTQEEKDITTVLQTEQAE
jgi:hypothetical protein|tara:strand:- start:924 stop:1052 length:129 start_codon:yes stop_codon:yes gene_type:complete